TVTVSARWRRSRLRTAASPRCERRRASTRRVVPTVVFTARNRATPRIDALNVTAQSRLARAATVSRCRRLTLCSPVTRKLIAHGGGGVVVAGGGEVGAGQAEGVPSTSW